MTARLAMRPPRTVRAAAAAAAALAAQRAWVERCGGSLAGYRARYGADYGEGADAIYAADVAALHDLTDAAAVLGVLAARS